MQGQMGLQILAFCAQKLRKFQSPYEAVGWLKERITGLRD